MQWPATPSDTADALSPSRCRTSSPKRPAPESDGHCRKLGRVYRDKTASPGRAWGNLCISQGGRKSRSKVMCKKRTARSNTSSLSITSSCPTAAAYSFTSTSFMSLSDAPGRRSLKLAPCDTSDDAARGWRLTRLVFAMFQRDNAKHPVKVVNGCCSALLPKSKKQLAQ